MPFGLQPRWSCGARAGEWVSRGLRCRPSQTPLCFARPAAAGGGCCGARAWEGCGVLGRAPLCCSYPQPCQHRGAEQGGCCVREPTRAAQANPAGSACHKVMHSLALRPAGSLGAVSPKSWPCPDPSHLVPQPSQQSPSWEGSCLLRKENQKEIGFHGDGGETPAAPHGSGQAAGLDVPTAGGDPGPSLRQKRCEVPTASLPAPHLHSPFFPQNHPFLLWPRHPALHQCPKCARCPRIPPASPCCSTGMLRGIPRGHPHPRPCPHPRPRPHPSGHGSRNQQSPDCSDGADKTAHQGKFPVFLFYSLCLLPRRELTGTNTL